MAAKRCTLEMTLESVRLIEPETGKNEETRRMVTSALIWPRPTLAKKTAVQLCAFDGATAPLENEGWCERILFKETFEGRFGISLSISEPVPEEGAEAFFRFLSSAVMEQAADAASGSFMGSLLSVPFSFLKKELGKDVDEPRSVAVGTRDFQPEDLVKAGEGTLEIPLKAPRKLVAITRKRKPGSKSTQTVRKTLLEKDAPNGVAVIRFRAI